jgi:hypothetical protein
MFNLDMPCTATFFLSITTTIGHQELHASTLGVRSRTRYFTNARMQSTSNFFSPLYLPMLDVYSKYSTLFIDTFDFEFSTETRVATNIINMPTSLIFLGRDFIRQPWSREDDYLCYTFVHSYRGAI